MQDFNIENLVNMLEKGEISKDELVSAMDSIQFKPFISQPDITKEEGLDQKASLYQSLKSSTQLPESRIESILFTPSSEGKKERLREKKSVPLAEENLKRRISRNHNMMGSSSSTENYPKDFFTSNSQFLERMDFYQKQKETNRQRYESLIREQSEKECTFKPSINNKSGFSSAEKPEERLYKEDKRKKLRNQLLIRVKQEEERALINTCTFHPSVLCKTAKSRYLDAANEINSLMIFNKTYREVADDSESEYTFKPKINAYKKELKHKIEYLNTDPYIRLSQKAPGSYCIVDKKTEGKKQVNVKEKLKEFFNRQYSFIEKRKENKLKILKDVEVDNNPKINKRSRIMIKSLTRATSKKKIVKAIEDNKDCTFQPKILHTSKQRKQKTYNEMSYEPIANKEVKIEQMKKSIIKQQESIFTFNPELNKNKTAKSKLLLAENVNVYAKKIRLNKNKHQNKARANDRLKQLKEMGQYTYRPVINDIQSKRNSSSKQILYKNTEKASYSKIHRKKND